MSSADGKVLVLGVTGSIAAYKAADLTSRLVKEGYEVHVIMTAAACRLVGPQTFLTLSRNPVVTDLWTVPEWRPEHVALADRADVLLVAPATADFLAKMAWGLADDALSTYHLSHHGRVLVAPAMNVHMWEHPATAANCETLRRRGVEFIEPTEGPLACGVSGKGRFAPAEDILAALRRG